MRIVTEAELRNKVRRPEVGLTLSFPPGTRFSPSATDFIKQWHMNIRFEGPSEGSAPSVPPRPPGSFA